MAAILRFLEAILNFVAAILRFVAAIPSPTNYFVTPNSCKVELGCDKSEIKP